MNSRILGLVEAVLIAIVTVVVPGYAILAPHAAAVSSAASGGVDGARIAVANIPFRDLPIPAKIRAATLGDAFIRGEAIRAM